MAEYNNMQMLKRRLFAMRNGVTADALRRGGSPFPVIFGVNLPQLAEIAAGFAPDREFAEQVWANSTTRESQLIAPMLMPAAEMSEADARRWIAEAKSDEVTDVLCLKLLRKLPFAFDMAGSLASSDDEHARYAGLRLMCNLAPRHPQAAAAMGRAELSRQSLRTRPLAEILASYSE